ncbi:hypothetical protein [Streptomyces jeddahensis]|uniref:Tn3 transposase DDE domain protein n=1 Tax=Streptomyces jeddahensis TaxID=1716141 RepID=A0A177HVA3_9ACTN|nr:hypothetical protein [Streptomyces jeddahensis]OAH14559.1 hypothetical protein STSP_20700 [Streptomyces jeddahensis]
MHTLLDEEYRDRATGHTDVNAKAHMYINHYSISSGMMTSRVARVPSTPTPTSTAAASC